MALITTAIPKQNFELVRDKIGVILADELPNQATLNANTDLNVQVYSERLTPINASELSFVNISYNNSSFDENTTVQSVGDNTYFIDVYCRAKSDVVINGDTKSVLKRDRIVGVIRAILENPVYRTLGFVAPSLNRTTVTQIQTPDSFNSKDSSFVAIARITFVVNVPEKVSLINANIIQGMSTSIKLSETEKGFVYIDDF